VHKNDPAIKGAVMKRISGSRIESGRAMRAVLLGTFMFTATFAAAQNLPKSKTERPAPTVTGPSLFGQYCAVCHGVSGKGDGPFASQLKAPPADLTAIAKNNHGQFPSAHVRSLIGGDEPMASHGSRTMPIWGPIFREIQSDQIPASARLDALVKYLESIQQK
jgi:mono/diheme cytochrome c family protein